MITRLTVRNFKNLADVSIELGEAVVFIGPNNSGKTTALQALSLWHTGLQTWYAKRGSQKAPEKRPGVALNRKDLLAVPVPRANLLWTSLHTRNVTRAEGVQKTSNVRIEIVVDGITNGEPWTCGLEFDYNNEESIYCRPLRLSPADDAARMPIPDAAVDTRVTFLPPMSGLAGEEPRLDPGAVNVRLGEGRTAEVLRNLCYLIRTSQEGESRWHELHSLISDLFGISINAPEYDDRRGDLSMTYTDRAGTTLDISSAGRGLHQTMLVLAHLVLNPGSVLLLDEPDAHLEILRQRSTYRLLSDTARRQGSQVVAASHSEVVLNEAADRDIVVAFVGAPHRIDDRGSQLLKSLSQIGFDQYYQAENVGWVLYLEGSTDLAILQTLAAMLDHPVRGRLERPFVHYVGNVASAARDHFYGLREAKRDLVGVLLVDRLDHSLQSANGLAEMMWDQREIENYLASRDVLLRWAEAEGQRHLGPLFGAAWEGSMQVAINEVEAALRTLGQDPWGPDIKVSDQVLAPVFKRFYDAVGLPVLFQKADYHRLAEHLLPETIPNEVREKLDAILSVAESARPV